MEIIPFREDTQFREEIELNNQTFILSFKWNALNEYWSMNIFDQNENPLVLGIKLVTQFNLTEQLVQSGMPNGNIVCQNIIGGFEKIKRNDMGLTNELVFYNAGQL